jgi:hypothetical protein
MVEKQDAGKDQSGRADASVGAKQGVSVDQSTESAQAASVSDAPSLPMATQISARGAGRSGAGGDLEIWRPLN